MSDQLTKRIYVRLRPEEFLRLRLHAARKGNTLSDVVRRELAELLARDAGERPRTAKAG